MSVLRVLGTAPPASSIIPAAPERPLLQSLWREGGESGGQRRSQIHERFGQIVGYRLGLDVHDLTDLAVGEAVQVDEREGFPSSRREDQHRMLDRLPDLHLLDLLERRRRTWPILVPCSHRPGDTDLPLPLLAHHLVPSRLEEPDFDRAVRRPALPPLPEANERFLGDVVRPILVAPQRPAVPEGPGPEQLDEEIEGGNVIRADPLHDLVLVVARTALFIAHWGVGRQPGALGSSVLHIRREGAAWQLRRDLDFRDYWL